MGVKEILYALHRRSNSVDKLVSDGITNKYVVFANKFKQLNYRYLTLSSVFDIKDDIPIHIMRFIAKNGEVLYIENIINGRIVGAIIRGIQEKAFAVLTDVKYIPYGLGYMDSGFKYGSPIFVVEGCFDRDVLSQVYPNGIAMLGSGLSRVYLQVLRELTDKLILCYDSDGPGQKSMSRDMYKLEKEGFTVDCLFQYGKYKDPGTIEEQRQSFNDFEYNLAIDYYRNSFNTILARRSH